MFECSKGNLQTPQTVSCMMSFCHAVRQLEPHTIKVSHRQSLAETRRFGTYSTHLHVHSPNFIGYCRMLFNIGYMVTLHCHLPHVNFAVHYADGKKQLSRNTSKSSIAQGTIETDNKRRPVLMKKGSQRFEPPPPEPPDPNSGTVHKNVLCAIMPIAIY